MIMSYVGPLSILELYNKLHRFFLFFRLVGDKPATPPSPAPNEHELSFLERVNLLEFIEMARNTYYDYDPDTLLSKFGYENDGLRVKVFEYDGAVVMAFKGTTLSLMGVEIGKTSRNDKLLDKVLYSRCGRGDEGCRKQKVMDFYEIGYFNDAIEILDAFRAIHNEGGFILTGHSLGGTLASLLGIKYGLPVIAFGSAGDAYIADVLGLYGTNNRYENIIHIGMCNDTIFRGECSGPYSLCRILGYNIETKCHVGRSFCMKDGTHNSLVYHSMDLMKRKIEGFSSLIMTENSNGMGCTY